MVTIARAKVRFTPVGEGRGEGKVVARLAHGLPSPQPSPTRVCAVCEDYTINRVRERGRRAPSTSCRPIGRLLRRRVRGAGGRCRTRRAFWAGARRCRGGWPFRG